jgi:uncharacterized protein (UPF0218 family)
MECKATLNKTHTDTTPHAGDAKYIISEICGVTYVTQNHISTGEFTKVSIYDRKLTERSTWDQNETSLRT